MADYMMVIEAKSTTKEIPNEVFVYLNAPWEPWKSDTWRIGTPNSWIGTGSGEYKFMSGSLYFKKGPWSDGNWWFRFDEIRYPDDCTPYVDADGRSYVRNGACLYVVANRPEIFGAAKWWGKQIKKDEPYG